MRSQQYIVWLQRNNTFGIDLQYHQIKLAKAQQSRWLGGIFERANILCQAALQAEGLQVKGSWQDWLQHQRDQLKMNLK